MNRILLFTLLLSALTNCTNTTNELEANEVIKDPFPKEVEEKVEKVESIKNNISIKHAVRIAENQFREYLPKILESHDAILDLQESYTGDFTGDGIDDIAIYFSLAPSGGGNAIVGQGISLYQNSGVSVKVIAGYEPDYMFSFDKIKNGSIYVEKLEYAENDGRCCPSIKTEHKIKISGTKAF